MFILPAELSTFILSLTLAYWSSNYVGLLVHTLYRSLLVMTSLGKAHIETKTP